MTGRRAVTCALALGLGFGAARLAQEPLAPGAGSASPRPGLASAPVRTASGAAARTTDRSEDPRGTREPAGAGRVTGRVVDRDGHPLPDVEVTLYGEVPPPPAGRDPESHEEAVRDLHAVYRSAAASMRVTRTDASGGYAFGGLAPGRVHLRIRAAGYALAPATEPAESGFRAGDVIDWIGTPMAEVLPRVLGVDGEPVPAFVIFEPAAGRADHTVYRHWEASDPVVQLAPGWWRVRAEPRGSGLRAPPLDIEARLGERLALEIRLTGEAQRPYLVGRLHLPAPIERGPVTIAAVRLEPGEPEPTYAALQRGGSRTSRDDPADELHLGVRAGRYAVAAAWGSALDAPAEEGWWTPIHIVEVAGTGPTRLDLDMPSPPIERGLTVRFVGEEKGERIKLGWLVDHVPLRLRDGSRLLLPTSGATDDDGGRTLFVESSRHGKRSLEVPEDEREITIRFEAPAVLRVHIGGYEGSGHEGRVGVVLADRERGETLVEPCGAAGTRYRAYLGDGIDARGVAWIGPIPPGAYDALLVVCPAVDGSDAPLVAARVPLTLASGENEVDLSLPPLYGLEVLPPEGGAEGYVRIAPVGADGIADTRWTGSARFDAESGRAWFERVPAGRYELSADGIDGVFPIEVPATRLIRLEAGAASSPTSHPPRLALKRSAEALAREGLRSGDRLVAIAGVPLDTPERAVDAAFAVLADPRIPIEVEREGARVPLLVDPVVLLRAQVGSALEWSREP